MNIKTIQFIWVRHGLSESNMISNQYYNQIPSKLYVKLMKKLYRLRNSNKWNKDSQLTTIGRKQAQQFSKNFTQKFKIKIERFSEFFLFPLSCAFWIQDS